MWLMGGMTLRRWRRSDRLRCVELVSTTSIMIDILVGLAVQVCSERAVGESTNRPTNLYSLL